MSDLVQILPLWEALRAERIEYVLATVVDVEGSGYRKSGARMLIAADGRRAGTVSGGCLEAEVARKAFWHTENGPAMRRYSTSPEDGDVPFGSGCGGVVHLLLERSATADPLLQHLAAAFTTREPLAIVTVTEGDSIGQRAFWPAATNPSASLPVEPRLSDLARQASAERRSFSANLEGEDRQIAAVRAEWIAPRPGLFIFGAGDDALPLAVQARQLGWYTAVADGRVHLATRTRFPLADDLYPLALGAALPFAMRPTDAAAIMTHSLQQDTSFLTDLLPRDLAYLGVLGPRHRTGEILAAIADQASSRNPAIQNPAALAEEWFTRLHAPMGLDLGGSAPADIALAIIAEIQQTLHRASGLALRQIRARATERAPIEFACNASIA